MPGAAIHDKAKSLKGSYRILVHDSVTGELIRTIGPIRNKIVLSTGRGYDLITRALVGDTTYNLEIDSGSIGTSNTAPTSADTGLITSVLSGIQVTDYEFPTPGQVLISFFISDGALANGTYREFGLFSNGRLFARSLLAPELTKGSNQNITIEYTLTFS